MIYKFGLLLLAAYVSVTAALPPCTCTRNLLPVCGSDGVTYANECLLQCEQTRNADLTLKKRGSCEPEPQVCICTLDYKPVCGSDGKSYPNECALECEKVKTPELEVKSRGNCPTEEVKIADPPTCVCTFEYNPVCGSDGKSYSNECAFNCQKAKSPELEMKSLGACQNEEVKVAELPTCICTREMKPVCGTNGITYANPCLLNCDSEKSTTKIDVDHAGACDGLKVKVVDQPASQTPDLNCVCRRDLKPVCGSDGVTYNNQCLMRCAGADLAKEGPC